MTAERTLVRCSAAREAGSGLLPWELSVRKNFVAISFSVYKPNEKAQYPHTVIY